MRSCPNTDIDPISVGPAAPISFPKMTINESRYNNKED